MRHWYSGLAMWRGRVPGRRRRQSGQAIIILALTVTFLLAGAVGLAVDAVVGYVYSLAAERAAASGALAGVVFMPDQFNAPPVNNATDRAIAEAKQNGLDTADTANGVQVIAARVAIAGSNPVSYYANKLQVTVSRQVPIYFMQLLGFSSYRVSRTAIATYLPPISLGQPGGQIGSATSQLGTSGHYFFVRTEAWSVDREQGDPFTTNPAREYQAPLSPASTDVHQISTAAVTEPADTTLPARGGYNYLITIPPSGGRLQIYNAIFGPDGGPDGKTGLHNHCDNHFPWGPCTAASSNYYLHEEDSITDFTNPKSFATMRYTLFQVNNIFMRSADTKLTQLTVYPIDATSWSANPPRYRKINGGGPDVIQTYDGLGNPTNMAVYHSWVDVATYSGSGDSGLVSLQQFGSPSSYLQSGFLVGGTYRLRVDTLDYDGDVDEADSVAVAHKGYSVQVLDSSNNLCNSNCKVGAWNDMCLYTPIQGGNFGIPLFELPPYYAGKTVTIDIYDPGDISGVGTVDIDIIDPTTGLPAVAPSGYTIDIYDLGVQRSNPGTLVSSPSNTTATFRATFPNGSRPYNGHWVHVNLPVPSTWNPGPDPNNWWWSLNYRTSFNPGAVATDTVTVAVGLKGNPAHLLQG